MRNWNPLIISLALGLPLSAAHAAGIPATIYRNPNCGCCNVYAKYLESNGFDVRLVDSYDMDSINRKYAVPAALEGCHTTIADGYVFEELIPAKYLKRVLNEHLPIKGLSLPGMPMGAPGMSGNKQGPLTVYYLGDPAHPQVFATF